MGPLAMGSMAMGPMGPLATGSMATGPMGSLAMGYMANGHGAHGHANNCPNSR